MNPTEEQEQIAFIHWCQAKGYKVHHSGNEVGGSTRSVKMRAIKMKKLGTSKGFPDLIVVVPVKNIDNIIDSYQLLAIEMKRKKGSTTSPEQKEWINIFNLAGIPAKVCKGCEEAIKFIEETLCISQSKTQNDF